MNDEPKDCLIRAWNSARAEIGADMPALDPDRYAEHVADLDCTDETKLELLRTLWQIMAHFVELGFGVESVQRCLPALADLRNEVMAAEEDAATEAAPEPAEKEDWS